MNVSTVLLAQAIQLGTATPAPYIPDLISALKERYGFVSVPTSAAEMLPPVAGTPLVFSHGKLVDADRSIIISAFKIYPQGFIVETATSTDDSERVIDDLAGWASTSLGVQLALAATRAYASQLEVMFSLPMLLDRFFPMAEPFGRMLQSLYVRYGPAAPTFQPHSFGMGVDPALVSVNLTCDFRVERRAKVPYDREVYFSQAPLKTQDHVSVLEEFERAALRSVGVLA